MPSTEPQLPALSAYRSTLLVARDTIVQCVDDWGASWWARPTIGHAGVVTQEFIIKQAGMAPRAVVTVIEGRSERLAGGKSVQQMPTWVLYILTRGRLENRTEDGLHLVGEAQRLIYSDAFREADPTAFCKRAEGNSVQWKSLYADKDEVSGYSIWALSWRQAIDLGTASRERVPAPGPLLRALGTNTVAGEPNDDTQDFEVT